MPRPKIKNVKVQNLERDLARRAQISETTDPCEAPEASQGPKGPIWRVKLDKKVYFLQKHDLIFWKPLHHLMIAIIN